MLNLIGVIIAFIIILVLIRKKVNFALSLVIGALIIGLFSLLDKVITLLDIPKAFIEASIYSFSSHQIMTPNATGRPATTRTHSSASSAN